MRLETCRKLSHGRSVSPQETVRRLEALLGNRYEIRLFEEQVAEHLFWSALFVDSLDFRAMGKGTTRMLSRAGAYAEAAEWLACRETDQLAGFRHAREDKLDPDGRVALADLLSHVATATPPVIEALRDLPDAQAWADGFSLVRNCGILVPIGYTDLISGPNGKAAGNTREEAIEHAALEVFERRVQVTVLRHRLVMPTIVPESLTDPLLREQLAAVRAMDIEVVLKDLSFGGALPCVGAFFRDPHIPPEYQFRQFFKVGASFDRTEALMRTLTEFVQGRARREFRIGPGESPDLLRPDFRGLRTAEEAADNYLSAFMFGFVPFRDAGFLLEGEPVAFEPGPCYSDCREAVEASAEVCRALGKDMIVMDLTDPDLGFPVVRVIVPGYSDVLPFHPASSPALFRRLKRSEVLAMYAG